MAKAVTIEEVKSGCVDICDLLKINAMLDMKSDCEYYYTRKVDGR